MIRLRLAQAAIDDLGDIWQYSKAAFGPAVAYGDGLRRAFAMSRDRPTIGLVEEGIVPEGSGFSPIDRAASTVAFTERGLGWSAFLTMRATCSVP